MSKDAADSLVCFCLLYVTLRPKKISLNRLLSKQITFSNPSSDVHQDTNPSVSTERESLTVLLLLPLLWFQTGKMISESNWDAVVSFLSRCVFSSAIFPCSGLNAPTWIQSHLFQLYNEPTFCCASHELHISLLCWKSPLQVYKCECENTSPSHRTFYSTHRWIFKYPTVTHNDDVARRSTMYELFCVVATINKITFSPAQ